jgi:hypothetical protein
MSTIVNTELVAQRVGRWYPGDLAFIDTLEYRCAGDDEAAQLRITARFQRRDTARRGWPDDNAPFVEVTMLFDGVSNLQLKAFGGTPKQITGFDITDVSDRGLEGVRFSVEDYEEDQISFDCAKVVVESVNT